LLLVERTEEVASMMKRGPLTPLLTVVLCAPLFGGCDDKPKEAAKPSADEVTAEDAAIQVELPPSPNFDEGKVADKWEDGSYSIYGLRKSLEENVKEGEKGAEIMIKGYVQEIYEPPECPEGETCPPGKQPHIWIADKEDARGKKRAMMIVGYQFAIPEWETETWKDTPDVQFEKGKRYTFKGSFKRFSDTGFADARGLLDFKFYKITDEESGAESWVAPPGAAWHPLTIALQEEQQKKLIEKVNKDASKK
jgi:hypothetical protein